MKISLVVPVFNEEDAIPIFYKTVREYSSLKPYDVEIIFVNDGSHDATESIIGNDSNLLIVFYVQIMPDDFVMQLHRF